MEAGRPGEEGSPESLQKYEFLEMKLTRVLHFICTTSLPVGV